MSEFHTRKPTSAECNARYRGLTFRDFCSLAPEDIQGLFDARQNEDRPLDAQALAVSKIEATTLRNFYEWRTYGMPDRDVSYNDLYQYMIDRVAIRKQEDPHYGELDEDDLRSDIIGQLLDHFHHHHQLFEHPIFDDEERRLWDLSDPESFALQDAGVIRWIGQTATGLDAYELQPPYSDYWLARSAEACEHWMATNRQPD